MLLLKVYLNIKSFNMVNQKQSNNQKFLKFVFRFLILGVVLSTVESTVFVAPNRQLKCGPNDVKFHGTCKKDAVLNRKAMLEYIMNKLNNSGIADKISVIQATTKANATSTTKPNTESTVSSIVTDGINSNSQVTTSSPLSKIPTSKSTTLGPKVQITTTGPLVKALTRPTTKRPKTSGVVPQQTKPVISKITSSSLSVNEVHYETKNDMAASENHEVIVSVPNSYNEEATTLSPIFADTTMPEMTTMPDSEKMSEPELAQTTTMVEPTVLYEIEPLRSQKLPLPMLRKLQAASPMTPSSTTAMPFSIRQEATIKQEPTTKNVLQAKTPTKFSEFLAANSRPELQPETESELKLTTVCREYKSGKETKVMCRVIPDNVREKRL